MNKMLEAVIIAGYRRSGVLVTGNDPSKVAESLLPDYRAIDRGLEVRLIAFRQGKKWTFYLQEEYPDALKRNEKLAREFRAKGQLISTEAELAPAVANVLATAPKKKAA